MIVSKPKKSTLVSLSIFILLDIALIFATITSIDRSEVVYWYHYLFLIILIPIGVLVLAKVLWGYKITKFGKGEVAVRFPVRFKAYTQPMKQINSWQEEVIKTASGKYEQTEIIFENGKKLTLGKQEHSNYEKVINYLKKKAGKKQIK